MANEQDQGQEEGPFFFKLDADEAGIKELSFKKDSALIHATMLNLAHLINQSFLTPFPSAGDFCRHLGEVSDDYDRMLNERNNQTANVSQRAAEEICGKETCDGICTTDGGVCPECNQGSVPPTGN